MVNRGRIQSQGDPIEDSEPWAQDTPLDYHSAIKKSENLEKRAHRKEQALRKEAHRKARDFMENAQNSGGCDGPISKTYLVKGHAPKRVDIEVITGIAFT